MSVKEVRHTSDLGRWPMETASLGSAAQAQAHAGTLRILYVEDNDEVRESIAMLLDGESREVVAVGTSEDALDLFKSQNWDVVITDISLPGLSGIELARRMHAMNRDQWIVLCSGHRLENVAHALGPRVRCLTKPFTMDELEELFGEITRSAQP